MVAIVVMLLRLFTNSFQALSFGTLAMAYIVETTVSMIEIVFFFSLSQQCMCGGIVIYKTLCHGKQ